MKCPKCSYLSLESGDRCKNCGYEFSLMTPPEASTPSAPSRPRATPLNLSPTPRPDSGGLRSGRPSRGPAEGGVNRELQRSADSAPLDLPLFETFPQGAPLPPPHRPLGVRRPGTVTPRPRPQERQGSAALPLDLEAPLSSPTPQAVAPVEPPGSTGAPIKAPAPAAYWRRPVSWLVDLCLILLVDVFTLYFTIRVAGLQPADWADLPPVPLAVFLLILNSGYVILLTATLGQTLGKMALQLEVVADDHQPIGVARASLRTVVALVSALPAGIGLLLAFVGDGRALHDRLTGTRVVSLPLS